MMGDGFLWGGFVVGMRVNPSTSDGGIVATGCFGAFWPHVTASDADNTAVVATVVASECEDGDGRIPGCCGWCCNDELWLVPAPSTIAALPLTSVFSVSYDGADPNSTMEDVGATTEEFAF